MTTNGSFTDMRPTLIIGLGGTGKLILTRLRALFEQRFGDVPVGRIRLLELDIDPHTEVTRYDTRETRLREEEFLDLGEVPAASIIRDVLAGHHEPMQGWLSTDVRLIETRLRQGGQQIRQMGRMAFLWHAERIAESKHIRKRLEDIIAVLTSQYVADLEQEARLNIYVISSLCGGTGSGMFIDLAYLLQDILRNRNLLDKTMMSAFFTTSMFFSSAPQPNLRPNTWAALTELDYFTRTTVERRRNPRMRYFDDHWIDIAERPYQFVYLIDAIDHRGYNIEHPEYMTRLVSDIALLLTASRIGDEAAARINNVRALRRTELGTVYSTAGVAALVVPIPEMRSIAAVQLLRRLLRETLLMAPSGQAAERTLQQKLEGLVGEVGLSLEGLHARLISDQSGRPVSRAFREDSRLVRGQLLQFPREALYQEVTRRVELVRPEVEQTIQQHMAEEQRQITPLFRRHLRQEVHRILAEQTQGPLFAIQFLTKLDEALDALWTRADREHANTEARRRVLETTALEAEAAFRNQARRGGWLRRLFRRGGDVASAETYLVAVQNLLDTSTRENGLAQLKRLVGRMRDSVQVALTELRTFQTGLEQLDQEELDVEHRRALNRIREMDRVRRRPIVSSDAEIEALYEPFMGTAYQQLLSRCFGDQGLIPHLAQTTDIAELKDGLLHEAREVLQPLADSPDLYVETLIRQRADTTPAEVLENLQNQAAYFWQTLTSEAVARDQVEETITVVGVVDPDHSIFTEQLQELARREGFTVIATGDPHAITVLKMAHGLAYDTLSQRDVYLHDYRRAMERLEPVHVFPEFNLDYRGCGRARRQLLAKAWAYGIVQNRMERFTYHLDSDGEDGGQLLSDIGLFDALWHLVRKDDLAGQIEEAVTKFEDRPKENLLKLLAEFEPIKRIPDEWQVREGWLAQILADEAKAHQRNVDRYY